MNTFDVVQMRGCKSIRFDEKGRMRSELTYTASKGFVYVFLLLDCIPIKDTDTFNAEAAMNASGWFFDKGRVPEPAARPTEER